MVIRDGHSYFDYRFTNTIHQSLPLFIMGLYPKTISFLMGDRGLLLEFGDEISREINEKVRRMALATQAEAIEGIIETVPTYRSLLIIYNPTAFSIEDLKKRLDLNKGQIGHITQKLKRLVEALEKAEGEIIQCVEQSGLSLEGIRKHCRQLRGGMKRGCCRACLRAFR